MSALFALILLAQSDKWVKFEICQLDLSEKPPVAMRQRDHDTFFIRSSNIDVVSDIMPKPTGLDCVQVASKAGFTVYVIGTAEEVFRKLDE